MYLVGERDETGTFWCQYETRFEDDAKSFFDEECKKDSTKHFELVQQIQVNKIVETHYPQKKTPPTVLKERYWMVEGEDRNPDYPGWQPDDQKFLSVSQAIEEAEKLAKSEGEFFKRFCVVEVEVETTIKEVVSFDAEKN